MLMAEPGEPLGGETYFHFLELFKVGRNRAGLRTLEVTPHGFRVGRATELRHLGYDDVALQRVGRWADPVSLRSYMDEVEASMADQRLPLETRRRIHALNVNIYDEIPELRSGLLPGDSEAPIATGVLEPGMKARLPNPRAPVAFSSGGYSLASAHQMRWIRPP
jgi:hypothetical protein